MGSQNANLRKCETMTNTVELKVEMVRNGDNIERVATAIGKSRVATSSKINNRTPFTAKEIQILSDKWNLSPERRDEIFFA